MEFPPPPPPPLPLNEGPAKSVARMMRWFQAVEKWEPQARPDPSRLLVAPPPRPPPLTAPGTLIAGPAVGAVLMRPGLAPYDFGGWVMACRRWWPHTSRHFDRLSRSIGRGPSAPASAQTTPVPSTAGPLFPGPASPSTTSAGGVIGASPPVPPGTAVPLANTELFDAIRTLCVGFDGSASGGGGDRDGGVFAVAGGSPHHARDFVTAAQRKSMPPFNTSNQSPNRW